MEVVDREEESHRRHLEAESESLGGSRREAGMEDQLADSEEEHRSEEMEGMACHGPQGAG